MWEYIFLIFVAIGTISAAVNASDAKTFGGRIFWCMDGGALLLITILQVFKLFILPSL